MFRKAAMVMAGVLMTSSLALADTGERNNLQVFRDVTGAVSRYTQFTIFDNLDIVVKNGIVTLGGEVTMPYKRADIERIVSRVDGVKHVKNDIVVLPASIYDVQLRYRIAR